MDLYQRLKAARTEPRRAPRERPLLDVAPGTEWRRLAPGVFRRDTRVPSPEPPGPPRAGGLPHPVLAPLERWEEGLFFDLETTGLSGGAGNVAFLAGFGRFERSGEALGALLVRQFFLSDFGAEPDFLDSVAREIESETGPGEGPVFVSYNGAAFDVPILRTRFLLTGRPFPERPHLDLLPIARRLYRHRLPDCRLGTIEDHALGGDRSDDLPGSLAPLRYREFHRLGDPGPIEDVVLHHRRDVAALAHLSLHVSRLMADDTPPWESIDPDGLVLLHAARGGETGAARAAPLAARFSRDETLRTERPDRWAAVTRLYLDMLRRGLASPPPGNDRVRHAFFVAHRLWDLRLDGSDAIRLAKLQEHGLKDFAGALATCHELATSDLAADRDLADLERRRARLERRRSAATARQGRERELRNRRRTDPN